MGSDLLIWSKWQLLRKVAKRNGSERGKSEFGDGIWPSVERVDG